MIDFGLISDSKPTHSDVLTLHWLFNFKYPLNVKCSSKESKLIEPLNSNLDPILNGVSLSTLEVATVLPSLSTEISLKNIYCSLSRISLYV